MIYSEQKVDLSDGEYNGSWSAYYLEILVLNNPSIVVETEVGVKGINCPVTVTIKNGQVINIE